MTKQEQIEEMATVISNYADKHEWELHEPELEDLAIELYNAGYRKIPDDSVVLSREEWKQIKNSLYYSKEELEKKLQRERKETEKEFAEKLKIKAIRLSEIENYHVCNLIDELLKEYEK